jgi:hypothetical protein
MILKAMKHCNGKSNSSGIQQFPFLGISIGLSSPALFRLITAINPEIRIGIAIWNHTIAQCFGDFGILTR